MQIMEIKWFGTAAVSYSQNKKTIIFDPFCGWNKKLSCPTPVELAAQGNIFITHGHFDHLLDVPAILAKGMASVHCSKTAAQILIRQGVPLQRISIVEPGKNISDVPFNIVVLAGRHIVFDWKLILKTIFNIRMIRHFGSLVRILNLANEFKEGQTLIYLIEVAGKTILHMGSLNLDDQETYPQGVDILALPYQGRSELADYALSIVAKIQPKTIYLHHFDDSFPPISSTVETGKFRQILARDFPEIKLIVPERGKEENF
jgi:L-ascorbate metabolism protein UlaG (beta-lactamase superfamily)